MALVIVATPGSATANSFVTQAEMNTYVESRLNSSAWTDAENPLAALVEATRDLTVLEYIGTRVTTTQALAWPREWATNPDAPSITLLGNINLLYYANTAIPQRIKDATCELALQYLIAGTTDLAKTTPQQFVVEKTVDALTTRWSDPPVAATTASGLGRFTRVTQLLLPLLVSGATSLQLARM